MFFVNVSWDESNATKHDGFNEVEIIMATVPVSD